MDILLSAAAPNAAPSLLEWFVMTDEVREREADNPSRTYLGDKNDNSKQVCN